MPFKFRFRKSVKIAPGVRLNVTQKGLRSTSIGGKHARVNISRKGTTASGRIGPFSWVQSLFKRKG
jgi:hypothetical protein